MNATIEIQKTDDGIFARRLDGKPLTAEDKEEARRMATTSPAPATANRPAHVTAQELIDIDNHKISAVLIDSDFGPLLFAFNDDFQSEDDIPVFYASELPFVRQMNETELRRCYNNKRALGGGWIRQRTVEFTKH